MNHDERRMRAVLIAGPTASGKSALALDLAERLDGVVVNADSMQVYRDLRILTARPSAADEARAPHRLYGTIDGACAYTVGLWLADVSRVLAELRAASRLPIVVGGTGLYFKALTQGLSAIPPVPAAVRAEVRALAATHDPAALHAVLTACDPATAAKLRPTDPQRIARALEVHRATGQSLVSFQERREAPILDVTRCAAVVLTPERQWLRERIGERFEAMIEAGALPEVEHLAARHLAPTLPVMRTLGVPPLLAHLRREMTLAEACAKATLDSRQYLKRQETFARHQLAGFTGVDPERAAAEILSQFV